MPLSTQRRSALQDMQDLFELEPDLPDDLVALTEIHLRLVAGQLLPRAADGEALVVEQAADLAGCGSGGSSARRGAGSSAGCRAA